MDGGAWQAAVPGVAQSQTWLGNFTFTFHFHALEKEMATHSSVLAWRIPGMGEPGGLPSMGSHRVGHDWSDLAAAAAVLLLSNIKQTIQRGVSGSQFPSPKLELLTFLFPSTYTLKLKNRTCLESSLPCYCSKSRNEVFPLLKRREVRTVNSLGKKYGQAWKS